MNNYAIKKTTRLLLAALLLLAFSACCACLADRPRPRSVSLDMNEVAIDRSEGDTFTLTATVSPEGASTNFKWWVSDASVLSVDAGTVRCLKPGTATVYVSIHGFSDVRATCLVTVTDSRAPERIIPYPSSIALEPGMGVQLRCVALPPEAGQEFIYSSSNSNVATVSEDGYVNVLSPGHATITVKSAYMDEISTEIKLTSEYGERIRELKLKETSLSIEKGESYALHVLTEPSDASRAVVYASADESIATVDENGVITAVSYGNTDISVSSFRDPSVSVGIPVSVTDRMRPETIAWDTGGSSVLSPGQSVSLNVRLEPPAANCDYTVTSSREDIVTVDGSVLSAVKRGVSVIRIQSVYREDLYAEFTLTVEDGTNVLVMPRRTTDKNGISENLAAIDRVKLSALSALEQLYTGGQIGNKEYERRVNTVNRAFEMYAFPWTVDKLVRYWKAENSENGLKDFRPGVIYYGLPYTSGENHNRAYNVSRALEQNRYTPVEGEEYYLLNRNSDDYATGYAGNDCSAFVAQALWGYTVYGDIVKTGTLYYDDRLRAFDDPMQLKAGDLLVRHSTHVVMFLYWADEDRTQAVFIQQGGQEPGINTVNTVVGELSYYTENSYRLRRLAEY